MNQLNSCVFEYTTADFTSFTISQKVFSINHLPWSFYPYQTFGTISSYSHENVDPFVNLGIHPLSRCLQFVMQHISPIHSFSTMENAWHTTDILKPALLYILDAWMY